MTDAERKKRIAESKRRYYERNKEACQVRCREYQRGWRKRNPKEAKQRTREWKRKNPDWVKAAVKRKHTRFRAWLNKIKTECGCALCGECRPVCLDFHHKDPSTKEFNVGGLSCGRARALKEIEKCVVLCANCHRVVTWNNDDVTD